MLTNRTGSAGATLMVKFAAVMAAAVLAMSGCYGPQYPDWTTFSDSDAVGSWCGQAGADLTVTDDENFQLTDMPADLSQDMMERHLPVGDPINPRN